MDLIGLFAGKLLIFSALIIVGITVVCIVFRDYNREAVAANSKNGAVAGLRPESTREAKG